MLITNRNASLLLVAIACLLPSCATHQFAGVEEYEQLTHQGEIAVQNALHSLEKIRANAGHCTPKIIAAFEHDVQRMQVDSIKVRARVRAIQARGDAYFASWDESIANIKDPRVRARVARLRPELQA